MGERFLDTEEVGSSILPVPTTLRLSNRSVMDNIEVRLPGGKSVEVRRGIRIDELASVHAPKGDSIVAAKIDSCPVDLSRSLDHDCALDWVSSDTPDGLDVLRHSTAHMMDQAVQSLFPGTKVTIGPTIEDGFY